MKKIFFSAKKTPKIFASIDIKLDFTVCQLLCLSNKICKEKKNKNDCSLKNAMLEGICYTLYKLHKINYKGPDRPI